MKRLVIFVLILWLGCVGVGANTGTNTDGNGGANETGSPGAVTVTPEQPAEVQMPMADSMSFIKTLMALCFVLGMIFLATYFFKKITGLRTSGLGKGQVQIHQVSSMPLGDKKFLSIVEIQGKHYFLGITQNAINLLSELQLDLAGGNKESEKEKIGQGAGLDFASILHKAKELLNKTKK